MGKFLARTKSVVVEYTTGFDTLTIRVQCSDAYFAQVLAEDLFERINKGQTISLVFGNKKEEVT